MKKFLTIFLFSLSLSAQTAQFPSAIARAQQLGVVANGVTGRLNNSLTTSSTSANITNGTCTLAGQSTTCSVAFQPYMFITIQNEIMQVCSIGSATGVTVLNFGTVGTSCPSISGRGLDGTQIAAHTIPSFPNTITVYNNITAWPHMADSAEIQAIETTMFPAFAAGAQCNGTFDDTTAIQSAINNLTSYQELNLPGNCIVQALYIPSSKIGMHIKCTVLNTGNCLTAKAGFTGSMLTVYAVNTVLDNLILNCNSTATNAITFVAAQSSKLIHPILVGCTGDGIVLNNEGGPSTALTSAVTAGSINPSFTVANASLTGYPLSGLTNNGGFACAAGFFDFGTATQESKQFTRSGNTITVVGTMLYNHLITTGTFSCIGNNDQLKMDNPTIARMGGWCINFMPSPDNNGIYMLFPDLESCTLGGILLSGSVNSIIGFNAQGNTGPAIQLGDLLGGSTGGVNGRYSAQNHIIAPMDMENSSGNNTILSVCDTHSKVEFKLESELTFYTGGHCPSLPVYNTTGGSGFTSGSGSSAVFVVKTAQGTAYIQPAGGISFFNASGVQQYFPLQATSITDTGTLLLKQGANYAYPETGADGHWAASLPAPLNTIGNSVALTDNFTITVVAGHALTAGTGNKLALNGGAEVPISNDCTPATFSIGKNIAVNARKNLKYSTSNGVWQMEGVCP